MMASSPYATSLSARRTHQFIVVTCGLLELRSRFSRLFKSPARG